MLQSRSTSRCFYRASYAKLFEFAGAGGFASCYVASPTNWFASSLYLGERVLRWKVIRSLVLVASSTASVRVLDSESPLGGTMQATQGSGGETIRVRVVDDTRIHTQLLADALRRDRQLEVVSPPTRTRDLVETVRAHKVSVVVLSSNLDEEPLRGFELLRQLRASDAGILAIMLLDSSKREAILQAFRAGARGIFSRH